MVGAQLSGLTSTGATGPSQLALISLGVVLFVLGGGVLLFGTRFRPAAAPARPGRPSRSGSSWWCGLPPSTSGTPRAGCLRPSTTRARSGQAAPARVRARQSRVDIATPVPTPTAGARSAPQGLTARYPGQPARPRPCLRYRAARSNPVQRLLLLGPNGAGKSTFIRVFAGLMHATVGQGTGPWAKPARSARRLVGVVSHATYLYDELTACREPASLRRALRGTRADCTRATAMLDAGRPAAQRANGLGRLSRGQQQRVTIARAAAPRSPGVAPGRDVQGASISRPSGCWSQSSSPRADARS